MKIIKPLIISALIPIIIFSISIIYIDSRSPAAAHYGKDTFGLTPEQETDMIAAALDSIDKLDELNRYKKFGYFIGYEAGVSRWEKTCDKSMLGDSQHLYGEFCNDGEESIDWWEVRIAFNGLSKHSNSAILIRKILMINTQNQVRLFFDNNSPENKLIYAVEYPSPTQY